MIWAHMIKIQCLPNVRSTWINNRYYPREIFLHFCNKLCFFLRARDITICEKIILLRFFFLFHEIQIVSTTDPILLASIFYILIMFFVTTNKIVLNQYNNDWSLSLFSPIVENIKQHQPKEQKAALHHL